MGGRNELGNIRTGRAADRRVRVCDHLREVHARHLLHHVQEAVTDPGGD